MELKGKKVVIVGAAKTGLAMARYAASRGAKVIVNDQKTRAALGATATALEALGATLHCGGHPHTLFERVDLVIPSPGVPLKHLPLQKLRERSIPVLSELELASQLTSVPLIAVTGTNGKSTTVSLIHEMLQASGVASGLGGNIGTPFIQLLTDGKHYDRFVLEVSSYQLELIQTFHPAIAVFLNVTPDHLSRHENLAEYAAIKGRLFSQQQKNDWVIYNADDPAVVAEVRKAESGKIGFSLQGSAGSAITLQRDSILWNDPKHDEHYSLSQFRLAGPHNRENAMAAIAAARLAGAQASTIQKVLNGFRGLPHRFEQVAIKKGITFIDDSKATNVGATLSSVRGVTKNHLILLVGGEDKGSSYQELAETLQVQGTKWVGAYGQAADRLLRELGVSVRVEKFLTLTEAFTAGVRQAVAGDTVLLAPACASFDQYKDFNERGEHFRKLVEAWS